MAPKGGVLRGEQSHPEHLALKQTFLSPLPARPHSSRFTRPLSRGHTHPHLAGGWTIAASRWPACNLLATAQMRGIPQRGSLSQRVFLLVHIPRRNKKDGPVGERGERAVYVAGGGVWGLVGTPDPPSRSAGSPSRSSRLPTRCTSAGPTPETLTRNPNPKQAQAGRGRHAVGPVFNRDSGARRLSMLQLLPPSRAAGRSE